MLHVLELLVQYCATGFEVLWASNGPAGALALIGVVGLGVIALALCARYLTSHARSLPAAASLRQRREPADIDVLLSQSDPDADGHARPRAPGRALAVA